MKMKQTLGLAALTITCLGLNVQQPGYSTERNIIKPGQNCVAYKTHKTLAMVAESQIIGMNCNVSVKALKTSNGLYSAEIQIPISGFDSKEKSRDKEVAKILKANINPNLIIKVTPLPATTWKSMLSTGSGTVHGQLYIGNAPQPVSATIHLAKSGNHLEVYGSIISKFSSFGIKPPEVGPGGMIAKAADYLELHFNFLDSKVQNSNLIPEL